MMTDLRLAVIADDFTGAMDTGVMFANVGLHTEFYLSEAPVCDDVEVTVINTNSREKDIQSAVAAVKQSVSKITSRKLFKKIDSTMRGHIATEIETLLQITGIEKALICPSAIAVGRIVRDGILFVNETPLHETAFAKDPHYPATTSQLQEILTHSSSMHINQESLSRGNAEVLDTIRRSSTKLVSCDAVSDDDLTAISQIAIDGDYLPCGSMGLASTWIKNLLGDVAREETLPKISINSEKSLLIITGSRHPVTRKQIETLSQYASTYVVEISEQVQLSAVYDDVTSQHSQYETIVLGTPSTRITDRTIMNHIYSVMRDLLKRLCDESWFAGMVIVGGETAFHVCQSLGANAIRILGEIEGGVPVGQMIGGCANSLPIVTKAGGYGTDSTLCHVVDWLKLQD